MAAKDEAVAGSAVETDNNDDSSLSNSLSEEVKAKADEIAASLDVEERLETGLNENKQLKMGLGRKEKQIQDLNEKVEELPDGKNTMAAVAVGHEENLDCRKDAFAIFPEEIWRMLLGNLTDPQDLWRCYNTCELFGDILSKWRAGWMMEVALPYLYHHLPRNKLLECRLVCTGWNKKINNFLEDHPSLRPHGSKRDPQKLEFINPVLEKGLNERNTYNFWNLDCNPILQKTFTGNPFLGRYVTLMMSKDDERYRQENSVTKFYEKVYTFLGLYGKEIFYLNLRTSNPCGPRFRNEADLDNQKFTRLVTLDIFHLIPNLRKLRLVGEDYEYRRRGIVYIHPGSLPPAPNLDSLEVEDTLNIYTRHQIHQALMLRYHAQLRKLSVSLADWDEEVRSLEWPRLTELNLRIKGWDSSVVARMPSLSKLGLTFTYSSLSNFHLNVEGLRELCLSTRLDTLRLAGLDVRHDEVYAQNLARWCGPPTYAQSLTEWIAPSTLETLELDNFFVAGPQSAYTFLLLKRFPHIKNLHIFLRAWAGWATADPWRGQTEVHVSTGADEIRSVVQDGQLHTAKVSSYLGSGGNVYESNIWELLPNLNVFTFQWDVYTRDGYEDYLTKKNLRLQNQL